MQIIGQEPDGQFRPVVENRNVKDAFLTEVPNKMKDHSAMPMLIGLTSGEGGIKTNGTWLEKLNHQDVDRTDW